jgi:PAS domain S-box-containing protein
MTKRKSGMRNRASIVVAVALVLATAAFAVALTALAADRRAGHQLGQELIPADVAADDIGRLYAAQQVTLRGAVSAGEASSLGTFRAEGIALTRAASEIRSLTRNYPPVIRGLDAATAAYRAWLASVATPQVAALSRGDVAGARALQDDLARTRPPSLATRAAVMALQSGISGIQQEATDRLQRAQDMLLGAVIAMMVVVAGITVDVVLAVWGGMIRPFGTLRKAVETVADGSYHTQIPVVGSSELADISRSIERMRTRLVASLAGRERAEEGFQRLFDSAPDPLIAVSSDGEVVMANLPAVRLFGYPLGELLGLPVEMLVPQKGRPAMAAGQVRFFSDPSTRSPGEEIRMSGQRGDGSKFHAEVRVSWLPTNGGSLAVASIRDVSERLAMEAEHERLRLAAEHERVERRLQQSRRLESLGQLVGGVAHDFNNLLNVISGYADFSAEQLAPLAQSDSRLEAVLADIGQVRSAAQQAIRVTRQLLTFSRNEAPKPEVLDLNELVASAGQLLGRSLGERVELAVSPDPGLWRVTADRGQLEQILVNLAVNARDAMPGGGLLTISTSNAEVDATYASGRPNLKPGNYARLAVSDTGTGMDQATLERVFEPFFSTKPKGHGTGLGLATVYGIVASAGGSVDIYSEVGLGSTVSVLLPATDAEAAPAADPGSLDDEQRGHGETILLVEDEAGLQQMVGRILARNGYQVCDAATGEDAVRRARDHAQRIDLLLTDVIMPGMPGDEVAAGVQAIRPSVPVLLMSGYAQPILDHHGIPAPGYDILHKPFTERALLVRVHETLSRAGPRPPGSRTSGNGPGPRMP